MSEAFQKLKGNGKKTRKRGLITYNTNTKPYVQPLFGGKCDRGNTWGHCTWVWEEAQGRKMLAGITFASRQMDI